MILVWYVVDGSATSDDSDIETDDDGFEIIEEGADVLVDFWTYSHGARLRLRYDRSHGRGQGKGTMHITTITRRDETST